MSLLLNTAIVKKYIMWEKKNVPDKGHPAPPSSISPMFMTPQLGTLLCLGWIPGGATSSPLEPPPTLGYQPILQRDAMLVPQGCWGAQGLHYGTRWQALGQKAGVDSLGPQRCARDLCPAPGAHLGVYGRREDRGDAKQAVVEGDLLQGVVAHGPHHHHIAVPLI